MYLRIILLSFAVIALVALLGVASQNSAAKATADILAGEATSIAQITQFDQPSTIDGAATNKLLTDSVQCRSLHVLTEIICAVGSDDECEDAIDVYEATCGGTYTNTNGITNIDAPSGWVEAVIALHGEVASDSTTGPMCPLLELITCLLCILGNSSYPPGDADCQQFITEYIELCGGTFHCPTSGTDISATDAWINSIQELKKDLKSSM